MCRFFRRPFGRGTALVAGFALTGIALFCCYLRQSRTAGVNSDAASQALQGWDMLHGNWLLRGWSLSDVSFWPTEVPEYALVEAVRGLGPDVVHVSAALTYTWLVLLAALLARGSSTGREGVVRALLTGGIMVAPQFTPGTQVLLLAPDHTGTGVPLLLLLLLLDRLPERWYVPVAMFVLLTWAQVADTVATYAAAVPLVLVCGGRMLAGAVRAGRAVHAGRAGRLDRSRWFDGALAVAGAASYPATRLTLHAIRAAGGFSLHPVRIGFASLSAIPRQSWTTVQDVLGLFGADFVGQPPGPRLVIALVHLASVALVGWAFCAGLRAFFRGLDRVSQILVAGAGIVLAAGLLSTVMTGVYGMHEIVVVLPYGAVLAGRLLGARLLNVRLVPALAVALACYLAALGYSDFQPETSSANADLTAWLQSHGLRSGIAGYWQADSVRLNSGEQVRLASLGTGTLADTWESKQEWFDPEVSSANFVVTVSWPPVEAADAEPAKLVAMFGRPARVYWYGRYTIMVWNHNLLRFLKSR
jgi:hypothetical protein